MRRAVVAFLVAVAALGLVACGGSGDEEPATPATTEGQPAIVVEAPASGANVTSPVTVSGTADVFEANVTVIVKDAEGDELARDFTTATCGTGCRGDFSIELPFTVEEEQPGTIVVQDDDAAGAGRPPHVVEIPVVLGP